LLNGFNISIKTIHKGKSLYTKEPKRGHRRKIHNLKITHKAQLNSYTKKYGIFKHNWKYRALVLKDVKEEIKKECDVNKLKRLYLFKRSLRISLRYTTKRYNDRYKLHKMDNYEKLYSIQNYEYSLFLIDLKHSNYRENKIQNLFDTIYAS